MGSQGDALCQGVLCQLHLSGECIWVSSVFRCLRNVSGGSEYLGESIWASVSAYPGSVSGYPGSVSGYPGEHIWVSR